MDGRGYCEVSCASRKTRKISRRDWCFLANNRSFRRLFLSAEEALNSIDSVGRILRTRLCEIAKRASRTAQLRFQHVGCDASNVRNKSRIRSGALNQKRNCRAAL